MSGFDLCDMMIEFYGTNIRSNKWYMQIVYYGIDLAVVNSWLLYRKHMKQYNNAKYLPSMEFGCSVASALLHAKKTPAKKRGRPLAAISDENLQPVAKRNVGTALPTADVRYDQHAHWPIHRDKNMRCRLCSVRNTRIACSKCGAGLCLNNHSDCFVKFHAK